MEHWNKYKYFRPFDTSDNWGDPQKMNPDLLVRLDSLRKFIGHALHVTSAYRQMDKKQHGLGNAVDIICPAFEDPSDLFDLYLCAERFNFTGIGIYVHWAWQGKTVGGLHVDVREIEDGFPKGSRWLSYRTPGGTQEYTSLNCETIRSFGLV